MDTPICEICAKTGVLCTNCEDKLHKGRISELDVELSKIFQEMNLEGSGFEKAIDSGEYIIILAKKENIGKIIGKGGETIRNISKRLGKKVKTMGTENLHDTIYDFVAPAQISSINTVYMPDGGLIRRIKITPESRKKLRMEPKDIEKLLSSLTTDRIEITFE